MELPLYAQGPVPEGLGMGQTMSHLMPTNYRELSKSTAFTLSLYLAQAHR
jgi:hypothetical protein